MQSPIEALPDGTIVAGHRRAQAARHLGWSKVEVWVRDDLKAQGDAAVEDRFIWDNLGRRQMGPLEIARCYQRLKTNFRVNQSDRLSDRDKRDLRDQIGQRLGLSGRNLDRYL